MENKNRKQFNIFEAIKLLRAGFILEMYTPSIISSVTIVDGRKCPQVKLKLEPVSFDKYGCILEYEDYIDIEGEIQSITTFYTYNKNNEFYIKSKPSGKINVIIFVTSNSENNPEYYLPKNITKHLYNLDNETSCHAYNDNRTDSSIYGINNIMDTIVHNPNKLYYLKMSYLELITFEDNLESLTRMEYLDAMINDSINIYPIFIMDDTLSTQEAIRVSHYIIDHAHKNDTRSLYMLNSSNISTLEKSEDIFNNLVSIETLNLILENLR